MARSLWTSKLAGATLVALALAAWPMACARRTCDPHAEHAKLDFTLKDMNGHDVQLAAFKGHPLLINFWATWCGPCKEEIPTLIQLTNEHKSDKLTVLGISIDDDPKDLQKYASEHKMNYPVLVGLGHDELLEAYDAQFSVPVSWFVTPDGCVSSKHLGIATKDWFEQQVKALL
jgi:thiol-disulfide isomerase/thioredoxin